MATRASSPYGLYGETGPYNQKNDQWNTRRPPKWNPYGFTGGDTEAMMANPQMQRFTSMLRGPDGEPLEEPPPPAPPRFGGGRASMQALSGAVGDVRSGFRFSSPQDTWLAEKLQDPEAAAGNDLQTNLAVGKRVVEERRRKMGEDYDRGKHRGGAIGGPDFGRSYGMGYQNDGTSWGDFFTAMVGKEALTEKSGKKMRVGWGGFGRTKAYDPALAQMYDLESGEMPPQEYAPNQMEYISRSQPAMNALRRAIGLPGVVL